MFRSINIYIYECFFVDFFWIKKKTAFLYFFLISFVLNGKFDLAPYDFCLYGIDLI